MLLTNPLTQAQRAAAGQAAFQRAITVFGYGFHAARALSRHAARLARSGETAEQTAKRCVLAPEDSVVA